MTNQDAIETIEANYPPENYSMLREALDMAIELLKEQELKEQCLKTKCVICPHCDNCDVDQMGRIKEQENVRRKETNVT